MVDEEKKTSEGLSAEKKYNTAVEEASDYIEHFDILETITNVGNDEVFTPRKTADMILDSLPEEVWHNPNYRWLNPATKNGIFEREIAIRLDEGLKEIIPDKETRRKHILQNMIFAIGQTKFTSNVARRTVYYCSEANRKCDGIKAPDGHYVNGYAIGNGSWFDNEEGNIKTPCTDHEIDPKTKKCKYCGLGKESKYLDANQREKYAYEFIHVNHLVIERHLNNRFFGGNKKMKFDIIIGNPPYQLATSGSVESQAVPIYQKFVEQAKNLSPKYLCMIIPSRWMIGGFALDDFRDAMLNDKRISLLHDFMNSTDVFPTISLAGGVCYFLWESEHDGPCKIVSHRDNGDIVTSTRFLKIDGVETMIRYEEATSILKKVLSKKEKMFDSLVSQRDPYGLNYFENGHENMFKNFWKEQKQGDLKIYSFGWKRDGVNYTKPEFVTTNKESIPCHKVFISKANGAASNKAPYSVISEPFVAEPGSICNMTYLLIGGFDSEVEAKNCCAYIKTKFFRFLVSLLKNTQNAYRKVYSFVPTQDFSIKWTDKMLYEKYNLNQSEIAFIETLIKEMN